MLQRQNTPNTREGSFRAADVLHIMLVRHAILGSRVYGIIH